MSKRVFILFLLVANFSDASPVAPKEAYRDSGSPVRAAEPQARVSAQSVAPETGVHHQLLVLLTVIAILEFRQAEEYSSALPPRSLVAYLDSLPPLTRPTSHL